MSQFTVIAPLLSWHEMTAVPNVDVPQFAVPLNAAFHAASASSDAQLQSEQLVGNGAQVEPPLWFATRQNWVFASQVLVGPLSGNGALSGHDTVVAAAAGGVVVFPASGVVEVAVQADPPRALEASALQVYDTPPMHVDAPHAAVPDTPFTLMLQLHELVPSVPEVGVEPPLVPELVEEVQAAAARRRADENADDEAKILFIGSDFRGSRLCAPVCGPNRQAVQPEA